MGTNTRSALLQERLHEAITAAILNFVHNYKTACYLRENSYWNNTVFPELSRCINDTDWCFNIATSSQPGIKITETGLVLKWETNSPGCSYTMTFTPDKNGQGVIAVVWQIAKQRITLPPVTPSEMVRELLAFNNAVKSSKTLRGMTPCVV